MLLTEEHDGSTVTARVGDTIEVSLAENPSTGYRWDVTELDDSVVSAGESSFSPAGDGIGAGGSRHMVFRVRHAGITRIELTLRRNWDPAGAALQHWGVTIEVVQGDPADLSD